MNKKTIVIFLLAIGITFFLTNYYNSSYTNIQFVPIDPKTNRGDQTIPIINNYTFTIVSDNQSITAYWENGTVFNSGDNASNVIQSCLDYLNQTINATNEVTEGICLSGLFNVSNTIYIPSYIALDLTCATIFYNCSILFQTRNIGEWLESANIQIFGGRIIGNAIVSYPTSNSSASDCYAIKISGWNTRIINTYFQNISGTAIYLFNGWENRIQGINIQWCSNNGIVLDGYDSYISDSIICGCAEDGIKVINFANLGLYNLHVYTCQNAVEFVNFIGFLTIDNCIFESNFACGLKFSGRSYGITITNCMFFGNSFSNIFQYSDIFFNDASEVIITTCIFCIGLQKFNIEYLFTPISSIIVYNVFTGYILGNINMDIQISSLQSSNIIKDNWSPSTYEDKINNFIYIFIWLFVFAVILFLSEFLIKRGLKKIREFRETAKCVNEMKLKE